MLCSKFFQVIVTIKICQGLTLFFSPSIEIFNICGWYSELFSESPRIGFLAIHRGSKSLTKHCCSEWLAAPHLWDSHYKQWMCNDYKYVTYLFLSSKIINQYLDISILVHCFPILTIFFYGVGQFLGHREKKHHSKPWNKKNTQPPQTRAAVWRWSWGRPHSAHDLTIGPLGDQFLGIWVDFWCLPKKFVGLPKFPKLI